MNVVKNLVRVPYLKFNEQGVAEVRYMYVERN